MRKVINIVNIGANFGREKFGIEGRRFGARISVKPCPIGEREGSLIIYRRRRAAWVGRWLFLRNSVSRSRAGKRIGVWRGLLCSDQLLRRIRGGFCCRRF